MKRTVAAVVLVAVAAGGAGWWWLHHAPNPDAWQGYVDAEYVRVSPTLTGRITSLAVARGDQVGAGAPLFTQDDVDDVGARDAAAGKLAETQARLTNLETRSRDTEIAQAKADLADLVATRDRIAKDLARNEELLRTGAASHQTVDQQHADLASAVARAEAANAKLAQMQSPTGREYEIAAQRAMVAQAKAGLAQAEWQVRPAPCHRARSPPWYPIPMRAPARRSTRVIRWSSCCRRRTSWCASSSPRRSSPPCISATG